MLGSEGIFEEVGALKWHGFSRAVSGLTCLEFSPERHRLTLARELAHRLIETDSLSGKDEDKDATLIAGAFMMPREHLLGEVGKQGNALSCQELIYLKRAWLSDGHCAGAQRSRSGRPLTMI